MLAERAASRRFQRNRPTSNPVRILRLSISLSVGRRLRSAQPSNTIWEPEIRKVIQLTLNESLGNLDSILAVASDSREPFFKPRDLDIQFLMIQTQ